MQHAFESVYEAVCACESIAIKIRKSYVLATRTHTATHTHTHTDTAHHLLVHGSYIRCECISDMDISISQYQMLSINKNCEQKIETKQKNEWRTHSLELN